MLEEGLILKSVVSGPLKDANLPLFTNAFKGTVLEGGLILKPVVSGKLKDISLPLVTDTFKGTCPQVRFNNQVRCERPSHGRKPTTCHGCFQRDLCLRKV